MKSKKKRTSRSVWISGLALTVFFALAGPGMTRTISEPLQKEWENFNDGHGGGWKIQWDDRTGLPSIAYGGRTQSYGSNPEDAALNFFNENRRLFGLYDTRFSVHQIYSREAGTGRRVTLQQEYEGIDVYNGTIHVFLDDAGRVYHVTNSAWPVRDVNVRPEADKGLVISRIASHFPGEAIEFAEGPKLVVYPEGAGRLAYLSIALVGDARAPWRILLDANTTEIIEERILILDLERRMDAEKQKSSKSTATPDSDKSSKEASGTEARKHESLSLSGGGTENTTLTDRAPTDFNDACDREWVIFGPAGEVTITPFVPPPGGDPYSGQLIEVAISSNGANEWDNQVPAVYAAGIKLFPCLEYTIMAEYSYLSTWDSYNGVEGYNDVFFINVNSTDFYWNLPSRPAVDLLCTDALDTTGAILPGVSWTFGGAERGVWCSPWWFPPGEYTYKEADSSKYVYLSIGLDTQADDLYPSYGSFTTGLIFAQTHVFDPNPITSLNALFTDQGNSDAAVPCDAYIPIMLPIMLANLQTPVPGQPWRLIGDYVEIKDIENPVFMPPPVYPYAVWPCTRSCETFEAAMCYFHLTQNQLYIQSLGFMGINNRRHDVDPHGLNGADNSHYVGNPVGFGHLAFGDGGVDDAEDADVILHEYGHSIQDNQTFGVYFGNGTNGFGDETGAMGEGFGDYWACSSFYTKSLASGFDPAAFAEWDAEDLQGLRRVDGAKTYPMDMVDSVHSDGGIWSAALWDLFLLLGQNTTDLLVLDHHFLVPNNPRFSDAAKALIAADDVRFGGANLEDIIDTYVNRGILRRLTVQSLPAGAPIAAIPNDCRSNSGGTAPFELVYAYRDTVSLTAPASHSGFPFKRWVIDGANGPDSVTGTQVFMDEVPPEHLAVAVYDTSEASIPVSDITSNELALHQNYPNPFKPMTIISFIIPSKMHVNLSIYDLQGKLVRSLKDGIVTDGYHHVTWDGNDSGGRPVSSGSYFYRITAGKRTLTKKMILLR